LKQLSLVAAAVLMVNSFAFASTIAYDYPAVSPSSVPPNPGNQAWGGALGMDFTVNSPIVVDSLGVFDDNQDGLNLQLTAYLYNQGTHALITSMKFATGTGDPLVGGARFRSIAPVILAAGTYTIVADGYGAGELNGNRNVGPGFNPAVLNTGGGLITFLASSPYDSAAGVYPGTPFLGIQQRIRRGDIHLHRVKRSGAGHIPALGRGTRRHRRGAPSPHAQSRPIQDRLAQASGSNPGFGLGVVVMPGRNTA
jgi:hypothetical protein